MNSNSTPNATSSNATSSNFASRKVSRGKTPRRSLLGGVAGLAAVALLALTPGCGIEQAVGSDREAVPTKPSSSSTSSAPGSQSTPGSESTPDAPSTPTSPSSVPGGSAAANLSVQEMAELTQDMADATEVVDGFWSAHWSDYFTGEYLAPKVVGVYDGYDPSSSPVCDGEPLGPQNAGYCPQGDYVAWDATFMARSTELGNSWVYLVIAHEWSHAMVAGLKDSLVWPQQELQADCLAGAAIYGAEADGTVTLPDDFEKQITAALGSIADDTAWTQSSEHGDAFERIEAFDLGRTKGVDGCI